MKVPFSRPVDRRGGDRRGRRVPALGLDHHRAAHGAVREGVRRRGHGAAHALAVTSATAGLHLAMLGLDLQPGDEVITTPLTWPATVNTILLAGGTPVLGRHRSRDAQPRRPPGRARPSAAHPRHACRCTSPGSRATWTPSPPPAPGCAPDRGRRARARRDLPRAADRRRSATPPSSASTRSRTSPPARAG